MVSTYLNSFLLFASDPENKKFYQPIYGDESKIEKNAEKFIWQEGIPDPINAPIRAAKQPNCAKTPVAQFFYLYT